MSRRPLLLQPWLPWVLGVFVVIAAWAFADNVDAGDWVLAGCFGLMTLGLVVQIIGLLLIRRRAYRPPQT